MTQIKCLRCDSMVEIPGSKYGSDQCDYCAVKNWGRKTISEINSISDNTRANIIKNSKKPLIEELDWLNEWEKAKPIQQTDDRTIPLRVKTLEDKIEENNGIVAWLFVHMEGKEPVQHNIKLGDSHIGDERGLSSGKLDVPIGGDKFVSRFHARLHAEVVSNKIEFSIFDNHTNASGRASTNGTFINGNPQRIETHTFCTLKDGDAIQVGQTILRLKTMQFAQDADDAKTQILHMNHERTVLIDSDKTQIIK